MHPDATTTWSAALARRQADVARSRARYRSTIVAAHAEGMSITAIAAALGLSGRRWIYQVLAEAGADTGGVR